jgi:hypothetical protein
MPLRLAAQTVPSSETQVKAVQVRVGAIIASNSGTWLDHRVAAMHPRFHTLFPYSSYRLIGEKRQWVPWGRTVRLNISDNRYVLVVPRELKNSRVSLRVRLMDDNRAIVDTILSLKEQGTFLVGGAPQPDGVLILSIGASTLP